MSRPTHTAAAAPTALHRAVAEASSRCTPEIIAEHCPQRPHQISLTTGRRELADDRGWCRIAWDRHVRADAAAAADAAERHARMRDRMRAAAPQPATPAELCDEHGRDASDCYFCRRATS